MSAYVLNHLSVIMCPHGGIVDHIPTTFTAYRVDGQLPALFGDVYMVTGCSKMALDPQSACSLVQWVAPSIMLVIKGQPALIDSSVGLCQSTSGIPLGPAIVAAVRSMQQEPNEFTNIDY
jgi:hypothetical protein